MPRWLRRTVTVLVTIVAVVAALVIGLTVLPSNPPVAVSPGALTPEQAEAGYADLIAKDTADPTVLPECKSLDVRPTVPQLGVVLLFHGYTSCPNQFSALAGRLAAAGYRVLVPRWPEHGIADTDAEPNPVDGQELANFAMRTTAIALGLDKRTVVGGLSGGATLALWAAEHNADVQRVVALAPFLGPDVRADRPLARHRQRHAPRSPTSTSGGTSRARRPTRSRATATPSSRPRASPV